MKRNWILIVAILVVLCAVVVNRISAQYQQSITEVHTQVEEEWKLVSALVAHAEDEEAGYLKIRDRAERIVERIKWESDSTNLLDTFDKLAKDLDLHLASSQLVPTRSRRTLAGSEDFRPMRFELGLQGNYRALTKYVDQVERASYAMLLEKVTMTGLRNECGVGDMQMTVLCLMPKNMTARKNDGEGS